MENAMPTESLELMVLLPGAPDRVYTAWLDSAQHAAFTGDAATIDPVVGGAHSAWDGYIVGKNVELEPGRRIVQTWRTSEFPDEAEDSLLELRLEPAEGGTRLILKHTSIPEGQGEQYEEGWKEYYFDPMMEYFTNLAVSPAVVGAVRVVSSAVKAEPKPKKKVAPLKQKSSPTKKKVIPMPKKAAAKKTAPKKATKAAPKKAAAKKKSKK
jgi:uncharacterized protein YndB with AHSA1/START domain